MAFGEPVLLLPFRKPECLYLAFRFFYFVHLDITLLWRSETGIQPSG